MIRFKKLLTFFVMIAILLSLAGCAENEDSGGGEYYPSYYSGLIEDVPSHVAKTDAKTDVANGEVMEEIEPEEGEEPSEETEEEDLEAGLITASAWDDNRYYSAWKELFAKGETEEKDGKFASFSESDRWGFDTVNRVSVTVKNGEDVVTGATVTYYDEAQNMYAAKTDARGVAYIFPSAEQGTVKVTVGDTSKTETFSVENRDLVVDIERENQKENVIKLMFVVDVTGSMGDELTYLQNELADVVNRVATENQGVRIDLAMLFYRDDDDDVKFSYADFVDVTNEQGLATQQAKLKEQYATGGGDFPEAVDEALELAVSKDWGDENSTKLIFHVLDAPPHDKEENRTRFTKAVNDAAKKGIRICPILCSGADTLCEYLVRQESITTGGTFVFITDHSGIGNPHYTPNLPNAVVEKLNDLMVRLINGYHTGTFADPVWWNAENVEEKN